MDIPLIFSNFCGHVISPTNSLSLSAHGLSFELPFHHAYTHTTQSRSRYFLGTNRVQFLPSHLGQKVIRYTVICKRLPHNQLISRERLYRGLFNLLLMMSLQRILSAWSRWASAVLIELATPGSAGLCLGTYRAHVVHRWSCPVSPGSYNNAGAPASDHYKEVSMSMSSISKVRHALDVLG